MLVCGTLPLCFLVGIPDIETALNRLTENAITLYHALPAFALGCRLGMGFAESFAVGQRTMVAAAWTLLPAQLVVLGVLLTGFVAGSLFGRGLGPEAPRALAMVLTCVHVTWFYGGASMVALAFGFHSGASVLLALTPFVRRA